MNIGSRDDIWLLARSLESRLGSEAGALIACLRSLFDIHECQWDLETKCRDPMTSLLELGILKGEIDGSNARRTDVIRWVDALMRPRTTAHGPSMEAVHWPLTLGQALDQLVISVIKSERVEMEAAELSELRQHQTSAVEDMTRALVAGHLTLPPFSTVKHYEATTPINHMNGHREESAKDAEE